MSMWLYQMSQEQWDPGRHRRNIWERERWTSMIGSMRGSKKHPHPEAGDCIVFFYAKSGGDDPGFYGWAIVLEWYPDCSQMSFRPVPPSDSLKMYPWWDGGAEKLADRIRGGMKQGTLWHIPEDLVPEVRRGIVSWPKAPHA